MFKNMYTIKITKEAKKDYYKLDGSIRKIVIAALHKLAENPVSTNKGGFGKPLKNKLCRFFKVKLKSHGIRIVYTLVETENIINIIAISPRDGNECYQKAENMKSAYGDSLFKDTFDTFSDIG